MRASPRTAPAVACVLLATACEAEPEPRWPPIIPPSADCRALRGPLLELSVDGAAFTMRRRFTVSEGREGSLHRLEITRGRESWTVLAPGSREELELPDLPIARAVLGEGARIHYSSIGLDRAFDDLFVASSARVLEHLTSLVSVRCGRGPACTLE